MKKWVCGLVAAMVAIATLAVGAQAMSQSGTTLVFRDTYWRCTRPLTYYAVNGLPLTVRMEFSPGVVVVPPNGGGIVQLGQGCVGPGMDGVVDLILDVQGDGLTYGAGEDAVRLMASTPGARDMDISGHADCGPRQGSAHQDGVQAIGGTNVNFVDFTVGDYDNGRSTCQGAGGAFFYSGGNGALPTNVWVTGGSYIGCNHSLGFNPYASTGGVVNSKFRSGRNDGTDPVCHYNSSGPCSNPALMPPSFTFSGNICDAYPFDNVPPPPPPPPDTTPPPMPVLEGPSGYVASTSVTLIFTDEEPNVDFACSLDGGPFETCVSPKTYTDLAQGSHSFAVTASDAAKNISQPASLSWIVDTIAPPAPVITAGPNGTVYSTSATFAFTDNEPNVVFLCSLDGGSFVACASPKAYTGLAYGPHSFAVKAQDMAGNESAVTTRAWIIAQCGMSR